MNEWCNETLFQIYSHEETNSSIPFCKFSFFGERFLADLSLRHDQSIKYYKQMSQCCVGVTLFIQALHVMAVELREGNEPLPNLALTWTTYTHSICKRQTGKYLWIIQPLIQVSYSGTIPAVVVHSICSKCGWMLITIQVHLCIFQWLCPADDTGSTKSRGPECFYLMCGMILLKQHGMDPPNWVSNAKKR